MEKEYTLFNLSFLIIVGLILIVLSASISYIVATRLVLPKNNGEVPNDKDIVDFTGITYNLGTFTTDLRDTNRTRIIKVDIYIELEDKKAVQQIEERKIQLQDKIITILRSKSAEELKGNEGKQMLSDEIKIGLEKFLSYKIINVYFNEFIIAQ
ncbi:flagellar basal body-associated FliL family protein [Anaerobranca gottschalkii]|uniref:Flagellar protein FliL n=1 Tax=Anaerobranca gottschalkii DSM 13577 TaxID=1120990 RepID=A0A1H9ZCX4_9FIRM|nr:flagellar basal body-associated FliL family protein [Anaerobranca gottschalkii]SES79431.1 flagellar FliL protein [Anaerobranca gottschalkii DSM 13577]